MADPPGGGQRRVGGDDAAELDHPAQPILAAREQGPAGGRAGKADRARIAAEVDGSSRFARTLVDEANRRQAVGIEIALAALRQQGDAGQLGLELQQVPAARRPPADLAGAANDTAPQFVAQGRRSGQERSGRSAAPSRRSRGSSPPARSAARPGPPSSFPRPGRNPPLRCPARRLRQSPTRAPTRAEGRRARQAAPPARPSSGVPAFEVSEHLLLRAAPLWLAQLGSSPASGRAAWARALGVGVATAALPSAEGGTGASRRRPGGLGFEHAHEQRRRRGGRALAGRRAAAGRPEQGEVQQHGQHAEARHRRARAPRRPGPGEETRTESGRGGQGASTAATADNVINAAPDHPEHPR